MAKDQFCQNFTIVPFSRDKSHIQDLQCHYLTIVLAGKFNLVVLTNALESVCNTVDELHVVINRLSSLLKPKGYLALTLPAEGTTWTQGPMLMITAETIDRCITEAGMCVKERRRWECTDDFTFNNAKFYYCVFAQKHTI